MLATCWTQGPSGSPTIPARDMNRDMQAVLDTGSGVTLLYPDLAGEREGRPMEEPESSPLTEFSDFLPGRAEGSARPGQFASAQLQDEALKYAWSHVVSHDGQPRDSVSHLPHPHFSTRGGTVVPGSRRRAGSEGTVGSAPSVCKEGALYGPHPPPWSPPGSQPGDGQNPGTGSGKFLLAGGQAGRRASLSGVPRVPEGHSGTQSGPQSGTPSSPCRSS